MRRGELITKKEVTWSRLNYGKNNVTEQVGPHYVLYPLFRFFYRRPYEQCRYSNCQNLSAFIVTG